jgi:hypothetical protein|tara:strand:+ start:1280 stop:1510 length:231 start_codon:yes stop_codon:yes gene_type:complete
MINTATELRAYYDKIRKDDAKRMKLVSIVATILILGVSFGLWFGPEPVPSIELTNDQVDAISNVNIPTPAFPPTVP